MQVPDHMREAKQYWPVIVPLLGKSLMTAFKNKQSHQPEGRRHLWKALQCCMAARKYLQESQMRQVADYMIRNGMILALPYTCNQFLSPNSATSGAPLMDFTNYYYYIIHLAWNLLTLHLKDLFPLKFRSVYVIISYTYHSLACVDRQNSRVAYIYRGVGISCKECWRLFVPPFA